MVPLTMDKAPSCSSTINIVPLRCPHSGRHAQAQARLRCLILTDQCSVAGAVAVPCTAKRLRAGMILSRYIAVVSMKPCSFPDYVMLT